MDSIKEETELTKAFKTLSGELKEDKDYYNSWKANIAMAFKDEYDREWRRLNEFTEGTPERPDIHKVANQAADNFLQLLIK